jgi:hypothetical protein
MTGLIDAVVQRYWEWKTRWYIRRARRVVARDYRPRVRPRPTVDRTE